MSLRECTSPPLAAWDAPGLCDHQSPLVCLLYLPPSPPARPVPGWRPAATGSGHAVWGNPAFGPCVLSWADNNLRMLTRGSPNPKTQKLGADTSGSLPSGLFPLSGKVGQLCSGLECTFGTAGVRTSTVPLTSPHQLWALAGSRSLAGASGGAARAHGSRGSGCPAERLPGSKVPS